MCELKLREKRRERKRERERERDIQQSVHGKGRENYVGLEFAKGRESESVGGKL